MTVEGRTYKDAVDHGSRHWTLAGILEQSSNVGMVIAGDKMTNEQRYLHQQIRYRTGHRTEPAGRSKACCTPRIAGTGEPATPCCSVKVHGERRTADNAVSVIANKGVKSRNASSSPSPTHRGACRRAAVKGRRHASSTNPWQARCSAPRIVRWYYSAPWSTAIVWRRNQVQQKSPGQAKPS